MQAGRAFSIASGGTTFARIAECGQAATQWLHWVQSSSFQMGISSAILRFSQRVVPIGRAVWRQRRNGEGVAKPGEHRSGYGFHEIRSGIGNHRRSIGAMRINWLQWNFFYGFTCQRQSLPVAFHQITAFATVTFGNRTLQFCEGTIAAESASDGKSHLHDGINTGRRATFAGDFRRVNHIEARFFWFSTA